MFAIPDTLADMLVEIGVDIEEAVVAPVGQTGVLTVWAGAALVAALDCAAGTAVDVEVFTVLPRK